MILPDVNVLVYAHKEQSPGHQRYHAWLTELLSAPEAFGMAELVLSGFIRVVTHPKIFDRPSTLDEALAFAEVIRQSPNCVTVRPGERHWELFTDLCRSAKVRGNLVPDAWFAALAIEWGCEWVTNDGDYARFPGLRWRTPLEA